MRLIICVENLWLLEKDVAADVFGRNKQAVCALPKEQVLGGSIVASAAAIGVQWSLLQLVAVLDPCCAAVPCYDIREYPTVDYSCKTAMPSAGYGGF